MWWVPWLGCGGGAATTGGAGDGDDDDTATTTSHPGRDSGEPAPDPDERAQNLASTAGDYALDFLRAQPFPRLVVEIDWVAGYAPGEDAVDHLIDVIGSVCDKESVEVVLDDELPSQGAPAWTVSAAEDVEVAWRDQYRDPATGTAVIYILYLDGHYAYDDGSSKVLGFAYHGSSVVMLGATIDEVEGALPPLLGSGVEPTTIAHELGHLLGLVDNGVAMVDPHRDAENGAHCDDDRCLMYWAVETDLATVILERGTPDFDDACLADLAAARGAR